MAYPLIKLFLSYAHDDDRGVQDVSEFLKELNKCFKASKHFRYELWVDRQLLIGDDWHEKITGSLEVCDYGLLLVSLSFVTSDYIREHELPALLKSGRALPIGFQKIDLNGFDLQGLLPKQIFRHKEKFYGELEKRQERADFVHALFQEMEARFLARERGELAAVANQYKDRSGDGDGGRSSLPKRWRYVWLAFAGLLAITALVYLLLRFVFSASGSVIALDNGMRLLAIPAGQFEMGGLDKDAGYVKPVHAVTIRQPFWISETEITFVQYAAYAQAVGKAMPDDAGWGRGQRPVIHLDWHEAKAYAAWLSETNGRGLQCRLPTEAEWEYAARGRSRMAYEWGEQVGHNNANCRGCGSAWEGKERTAEVGSFLANAYGLRDVHGNVAEWVEDIWHNDYQGAPQDGTAWMSGGNAARRVARGGSWADGPVDIRLAHRVSLVPEDRYNFVGFRVVCRVE